MEIPNSCLTAKVCPTVDDEVSSLALEDAAFRFNKARVSMTFLEWRSWDDSCTHPEFREAL